MFWKNFFVAPLLVMGHSIVFANGIQKVFSDPITVAFMVGILISAIFFHSRFDRFAVNHGPEVLTTIGIFGCFLGIAFALLDFNTNNITDSVPLLLDGVKTAFWASVSGILGALTIKIRHRFSRKPLHVSEGETKAASLEDVVISIDGLRKSISGDNDTSMVSQLKLMRQDQNDNANQLKKSLDDFAEKVSELGSKALIEALQKVIRDFNTQLNEQFGENFKQLNLAVEKLVLWQQQYKEELDLLQTAQKQSADNLAVASTAFTEIVERASSYTTSAENLSGLLSTFETQLDILRRSQEALNTVLVQMKDVEPSFSQKLSDLTEVFKNGTNNVSAQVQTQVKEFGDQLKSKNEEMAKLIKEMVPEIQKSVNDQLAKSQKQLSDNFSELDKNLEKELQKSLSTLGQQLASLSEKFVSDYSPLTDKLRDVVNLAKGV